MAAGVRFASAAASGKISLHSYLLPNHDAKKTSKNQLTLPKKVVERFPDVEYFEVLVDDSRISLVPVRPGQLQDVQGRLERLGITQKEISAAVAWARSPGRN